MKAAWQTGLVACFLSTLAGCEVTTTPTTTPTASREVGSGFVYLTDAEMKGLMSGYGADRACIPYITLDSKPVLVLWSDAPWSACGTSGNSSSGVLVYRGKDGQLNREVAFSAEIQNPAKGRATIHGKTYDLAKGVLFLVSGAGGDVQVKQLSSDVSKLNFEPHNLVALGKANPEITAFFSKPAKPKSEGN
jgi:hypothetical protein